MFATYTFMEYTHLKVCAPFLLIAVGGLWGQGPAARYLLSFLSLELLANSISSFSFKINIKKLNPQTHLFLLLLFLLSFCLFLWFAPFSNNWSQWGQLTQNSWGGAWSWGGGSRGGRRRQTHGSGKSSVVDLKGMVIFNFKLYTTSLPEGRLFFLIFPFPVISTFKGQLVHSAAHRSIGQILS